MSKKYIFRFEQKATEKPITYQLVKDFDMKINIISAKIEAGEAGTLILELNGKRLAEALSFVEDQGINVTRIHDSIHMDQELCVDCGACLSVCPTGALYMNSLTGQVCLEADKCVACGMCLLACPRRAMSLYY